MSTDVERAATGLPVPAHITQATAVEQARALGEVHAAVQVAQERPRDMARAIAEMRDSCGRLALASRAFYAVPNRGNGKSVHLARELARIWGNMDHGVHELHRDDIAGMSEIRAFAWDQQANVRSTRTFQVPHQRMKKVDGRQTREDLHDLGDVYRNNQNIGARAVRECIFSVLPEWFTEEAESLCRATLQHGEGVPLQDRIETMVKSFRNMDVTVDQLEQRLGRKRGQWTAADAVQMGIVYQSIQRGELSKDEEFSPPRVTAAEIRAARSNGQTDKPAPVAPPEDPTTTVAPAYDAEVAPDPAPADPITDAQIRKLGVEMKLAGLTDRDDALAYVASVTGRTVSSRKELTKTEASKVIDALVAGPPLGAVDTITGEIHDAEIVDDTPVAPPIEAPDPAYDDKEWLAGKGTSKGGASS